MYEIEDGDADNAVGCLRKKSSGFSERQSVVRSNQRPRYNCGLLEQLVELARVWDLGLV